LIRGDRFALLLVQTHRETPGVAGYVGHVVALAAGGTVRENGRLRAKNAISVRPCSRVPIGANPLSWY
jgi:hypothetical protein